MTTAVVQIVYKNGTQREYENPEITKRTINFVRERIQSGEAIVVRIFTHVFNPRFMDSTNVYNFEFINGKVMYDYLNIMQLDLLAEGGGENGSR